MKQFAMDVITHGGGDPLLLSCEAIIKKYPSFEALVIKHYEKTRGSEWPEPTPGVSGPSQPTPDWALKVKGRDLPVYGTLITDTTADHQAIDGHAASLVRRHHAQRQMRMCGCTLRVQRWRHKQPAALESEQHIRACACTR